MDNFSRAFPKYFGQLEIVRMLKEGIENFIQLQDDLLQESVWEDVDEEEEAKQYAEEIAVKSMSGVPKALSTTGSSWDYFGGPVYPDPALVRTSNMHWS